MQLIDRHRNGVQFDLMAFAELLELGGKYLEPGEYNHNCLKPEVMLMASVKW